MKRRIIELATRMSVGVLSSGLLLLTACEPEPAGGAVSGATSTAAVVAAAAPSGTAAGTGTADTAGASGEASSSAMALAMAPPGDGSPVDGEVRAAQLWVKRLPKSTDKLIELGRAWVMKARHTADPGYYLHARACVELVLEREPQSHLARELLAQVQNNQHQFLEAKDTCEQVLAKDAESLLTLAVYADVLYELGRVEEAITTADKLALLKPDLPSYMRVSFFQWLRGDVGAALRSAKLGIESSNDPDRPEPKAYALVQAASYFFHRGDYDGADEGYKKAASTFADYPPALVGRGRVALAKGDAKRAAELLLIAYKQAPLVETAWRLGDARSAAGDKAGAEEAFGWAVKEGRRSDPRTLSLFYSTKNRDIPEALRLAEEEMKVRPGIYTLDAYAWALHRSGKAAEARSAIDKATRFGTRDALLLYHAGAIRIAGGDREGGEKLVNEALALSPKFDPVGAVEAAELVKR